MTSTLNSIKHVINDRISSPLAGSFIISWLVVNYKFLIILFSLQSVENKFVLISFLFPIDIWLPALTTFSKLTIIPLAFTIFYIYLYPIPARKVYEHVRREQIKLEDLRNEIEKASVLTTEQANELRKRHYSEIEALRSELLSRDDEITAMRNIKNELQETISSHKNNPLPFPDSTFESDILSKENRSTKMKHDISSAAMKVLSIIYNKFQGENFTNEARLISSVKEYSDFEMIELEDLITNLKTHNLIEFLDTGGMFEVFVTSEGKQEISNLKYV